MTSGSLMLEQAQAFAEDLQDLPDVMQAFFSSNGDDRPVVHVGLTEAGSYNKVQSLAYKYGLEPRGESDGAYQFAVRGDVESAERGPARRL